MYSKGIEIPKVSFSALDYNEIEPGSFFIGFNLDLGGKLCKIDSNGTLTVLEGAGGGGSVISVSDDGQGIVEVYNVDPTNPIVKFNGIETDGTTITGDGTILNPLVANIPELLVNVLHSELVALRNTSSLIPGTYYKITDFQTIYDQPDYDSNKLPKTNVTLKTGPLHPIIVQAIGVDALSESAIQEDFPKDQIKYILEYTTPRNNASTKGRIVERIDEYNNKTDFDHRVVLFKRYYDSFLGFLKPYSYYETSVNFIEDTLFHEYSLLNGAVTNNLCVGSFVKSNSIYYSEEFDLPNIVFFPGEFNGFINDIRLEGSKNLSIGGGINIKFTDCINSVICLDAIDSTFTRISDSLISTSSNQYEYLVKSSFNSVEQSQIDIQLGAGNSVISEIIVNRIISSCFVLKGLDFKLAGVVNFGIFDPTTTPIYTISGYSSILLAVSGTGLIDLFYSRVEAANNLNNALLSIVNSKINEIDNLESSNLSIEDSTIDSVLNNINCNGSINRSQINSFSQNTQFDDFSIEDCKMRLFIDISGSGVLLTDVISGGFQSCVFKPISIITGIIGTYVSTADFSLATSIYLQKALKEITFDGMSYFIKYTDEWGALITNNLTD